MATFHIKDFPFEEIRDANGDYFNKPSDAIALGYKLDQIWSVIEEGGTYVYGPSYHFVNRIGFIATKETHDGDTYYVEEPEDFEDEDENLEIDLDDGLSAINE